MTSLVALLAEIFAVLFVLSQQALAHNVNLEKQIYYNTSTGHLKIRSRPWDAPPSTYSSFSNPTKLQWSVQQSQVVFAYLDTHGYDVYEFTINAGPGSLSPEGINDYEQAQIMFNSSVPIVLAAPLPAACFETKHHFPAVGLVAPMGSTPMSLFHPRDIGLSFDVPEGYGIFPVFNKKPENGEKRLIFEEPGESLLTWFMPDGCYFRGVEAYTIDCSNSTSLAAPVLVPSVSYYIVVWNPDGLPMDYTLNVGLGENYTIPYPQYDPLIFNNSYLHTSCSAPYPAC